MPDFDADALELWNKFCIADWMPGNEVVRYLRFAPAAEFASIDAIVFLQPTSDFGFARNADGQFIQFPETSRWDALSRNAEISSAIRNLPDDCAMRDGRKWKAIPQIALTNVWGSRWGYFNAPGVEYVPDVTEHMLHGGGSPLTWRKIESIVNDYHSRAAAEYERVGFLVIYDHGLYRVKRAFRKKNSNESDFYYGGKDKRRFYGFVTIGRDIDGVDYEVGLFEKLLNDPKAGERQLHRFFEEHPDLLSEVMMGVPISHKPYFVSNKQTPDFSVAPILPREKNEWVKLLELKGPEASVLRSPKYLHRDLAPALSQALAQVRDYDESISDPLNLKAVEKALGFVPAYSERAVLIGRDPATEDTKL